MKNSSYLTIDIGASSGRAYIVSFCDEMKLTEIHRFKNELKKENGYLVWNFTTLFEEVKYAIKEAFKQNETIKSLGISTWGCDYGYIGNEKLLRNPLSYRDERTVGFKTKYYNQESIYQTTGIQNLHFNTINQLFYDKEYEKELLVDAETFLMIPDLIAYMLTGEKRIELTNLSTTSLYNPKKRILIEEVKYLKEGLIPQIIYPGEVYGNIKEELTKELNIKKIPVVAVCTHDTASAIFSLKENTAYISSGTWSLMGINLSEPLINEESYKANFTNEIGYNHEIRFLKNITGFWVKNLILKAYKIEINTENLNKIDEKVKLNKDYLSIIDLDDREFQSGDNILTKINEYLRKTNQQEAKDLIDYITLFNNSLILKYEENLEILRKLTKKEIKEITVFGGGSANELLNQMTADKLNIKVIKGYKEATTVGNALIQYATINDVEVDKVKDKYLSILNKVYIPKKNESR